MLTKLTPEDLRKKMIKLFQKMGDDTMAKNVKSLSKKDLDKIKKDSIKLLSNDEGQGGGRKRKTRRKRKKRGTRKKRGGIGWVVELGIVVAALFAYKYFFEEVVDEDIQAYHDRTAAIGRRRRRLRSEAYNEGAEYADSGQGGEWHFPANEQYRVFRQERADAQAAAQQRWGTVRDRGLQQVQQERAHEQFAPGGPGYLEAERRWASNVQRREGGGGGS